MRLVNLEALWEKALETLESWADGFAAWLPHLAVALVAAVLFVFLGKGVRAAADRGLAKTSVHEAARDLLARLLHFAVLATGLMVVLSILELDKAVTSVLAGAGVVGLAVGFAFQDLAGNLISGMGLSMKRPFGIGDVIETNDVFGVAERIELRTTTIRTPDGKKVLVPNRKIFQDVLVNHTDNVLRRLDFACGVSYAEDLDQVEQVTLEAVAGVEGISPEKEPQLFFTAFGGSSIDYELRVWFEYGAQRDLVALRDRVLRAIKHAYDERDITIPFPIRTLDFGIAGGATLAEMLPRDGRAKAPSGGNGATAERRGEA